MRVIEAVHLSKRYGHIAGIHNLSLEVQQGEIFGLLGPNGAGKTTFIRLLLGLIKPSGGEVRLFDENVVRRSADIRRNIGYVPEELSLYEDLTAGSYLQYLYKLKRITPDVKSSSLDVSASSDVVRRFDIDLGRKIKGSSRGMKQRIGVAQAFLGDPKLLILDEASSGLDPLMREEYYQLLLQKKSQGKTILLASHIIPEIEKVCDRVGLIKDGRIIVVETVENLKKRKLKQMRVTFASHTEAAKFAGESAIDAAQSGNVVELYVGDNVDRVVKRISKYAIVDLSCREAPLEEIFAEFYAHDSKA